MNHITLVLAIVVLFFVPGRSIAQDSSDAGVTPDSVAEKPMQGGVLLPRAGGRADGRDNAYKQPFRFPQPSDRAYERANVKARFKRTGEGWEGEKESVRALGQEKRAEWKAQKKEMRAEWKEKRETLRGEWKEQKREARDAFRKKKEALRLEWKERRGGLRLQEEPATEQMPSGMVVEGENLRIRNLGTGRRTMLERRVSPRLRRR